MARCQNVKICGLVEVDNSAVEALLAEILAELQGPLVVDPSAAWEAIFLSALNASEITLDQATLDALENITVTVDTTGGPVEVTGTVTIDDTGGIDVNILNDPLNVNVTNFADLINSELTVTLDGEVVNVLLDAAQIAAIIADDDTDDDLRPVNVNCFNWEDGATTGTFIGWANAAEDGTFAGYTVISGTPPPQTATVTCDEMSITSIQGVKLDPLCVDNGAGPVWAYPVSMVDTATGAVTVTTFLDEMGVQVTGTPLRVDDCDCPQPECCEETLLRACTQMLGFDFDRGLTTPGFTTAYRISDNGTATATIVHDYTTTFDGINVSTYYDPIIAAINALPDWTITLVTDVAGGSQGKPNWRIEYAGTGAGELRIDKAVSVAGLGNSDTMFIRVDAAGVMTTSVLDGGAGVEIPDFNSPHFSPCP